MSVSSRGAVYILAFLLSAATAAADSPLHVAAVATYTIDADHFRAACKKLIDEDREPASLTRQERLHVVDMLVGSRLLALEAERLGLGGDERVRLELLHAERQAISAVMYQREVEEAVTISPSEVEAQYEVWGSGEEVEAAHILVHSRQEAEAILTELEQGADFAVLARERSKHAGSAQRGGSMGFLRKYLVPDQIREHVWEYPVGTLHPSPIVTRMGYHVVKILRRRHVPLAGQEKAIRGFLGRKKRAQLKHDLDVRLRTKYQVEWRAQAVARFIAQGPAVSGDSVMARWQGGELTVAEYRRRATGPDAASADTARVHKIAVELAVEDLIRLEGRERGWHQLPAVRRQVEEARLRILGQALFHRKAEESPPSDDEINAFYRANLDQYRGDPRVDIQEIHLATQAAADSLHALVAAGGDMGELARRHSRREETREAGGVWESVPRFEPHSATLYRRAMAGEALLDPLALPTGGFSVVRVLGKGPGQVLEFEEVGQQVRQDLLTRAMDRLIARLRREYGPQITVDEETLLQIR